MQRLANFWKDPVFSGLIAGVGTLLVVNHFTDFFNWLWNKTTYVGNAVFSWMNEPSEIPKWVLLLLCIWFACSLIFICLVFYANREEPSQEASWLDYKEDDFFNLKWRWQYVDNAVSYMNCFCPRCDFQILPRNGSDFKQGRIIDISEFACDSCNFVVHRNKSAYDVQEEAIRHVQRNLRTGDWKLAVSSNSEDETSRRN